jgi:hypothetical protein
MVDHDIQALHFNDILELEETSFETECECPRCLQDARQVSWEKVEGGSVNRYWRLFCNSCGHVDTNDIF